MKRQKMGQNIAQGIYHAFLKLLAPAWSGESYIKVTRFGTDKPFARIEKPKTGSQFVPIVGGGSVQEIKASIVLGGAKLLHRLSGAESGKVPEELMLRAQQTFERLVPRDLKNPETVKFDQAALILISAAGQSQGKTLHKWRLNVPNVGQVNMRLAEAQGTTDNSVKVLNEITHVILRSGEKVAIELIDIDAKLQEIKDAKDALQAAQEALNPTKKTATVTNITPEPLKQAV